MTTQNDISTKNSINTIYTELVKLTNNLINISTNISTNNSKIVEPFMLPPIDDTMIKDFNQGVDIAKSHGYEINFTLEELYNVFSLLELKTKLLTMDQRLKRKKIFTYIKDKLTKFKESGEIYGLVHELSKLNPNLNVHVNVFSFYSLLQNVIDLFLDDINNIDKDLSITQLHNDKDVLITKLQNDNNNNKTIILTLIILLFIVIFYNLSKK